MKSAFLVVLLSIVATCAFAQTCPCNNCVKTYTGNSFFEKRTCMSNQHVLVNQFAATVSSSSTPFQVYTMNDTSDTAYRLKKPFTYYTAYSSPQPTTCFNSPSGEIQESTVYFRFNCSTGSNCAFKYNLQTSCSTFCYSCNDCSSACSAKCSALGRYSTFSCTTILGEISQTCECHSSSPIIFAPWLIAVIIASVGAFLVIVFIIFAACCCACCACCACNRHHHYREHTVIVSQVPHYQQTPLLYSYQQQQPQGAVGYQAGYPQQTAY